MKTNETMNLDQLNIGLSNLMRLFQKLITDLKNLARIEKTLDLIPIDFFTEDYKGSKPTYEEMEIVIDSELKEVRSRKRAFNIAKVMLIVFEALNGYLASGILVEIMHINFGNPIIKVIVQFVFGALLSFAILFNAIKAMSPKNKQEDQIPIWVPIILMSMLPILNLFLILITPNVANKLVFVVTAIFTLIVGFILVMQAKSTKESNELRFYKLTKYKRALAERKKLYKEHNSLIIKINEMRPKYIGLFDENYLTSQGVEDGLIKFVKSPNQWCRNYIEDEKK